MKKKGNYYSKKLAGKHFEEFKEYFDSKFFGRGIPISKIYAIYNPTLVSSFCIKKQILEKKFENAANIRVIPTSEPSQVLALFQFLLSS